MDFGEFLRGGTAPTGKSKLSSALNPNNVSRPKTRAVDADIQDTNLDLRMNKNKSPFSPDQGSEELISEREFARINLNDWSDKNDGGTKRAPSRGKKSKDPLRVQNPLTSGLSAYTQNMPNIVLNTNRKSHKTSSSSPRPTSTKEHRTISQINELKAAYGADIPIGKPSSSASPGQLKPQPTNSKYESAPTTREIGRLSIKDPNSKEMKKVNSMDNSSVGSSIASSAMEIVDYRGKEKEKDHTPTARSGSSDVSSPKSPSSPHRKSLKKNTLLKVSFTSKASEESMGDHMSNYHSRREEHEREKNINISAPSPEPTDLIPVEDFFKEVMQPRPNNRNEKKEEKKIEKKSSFRRDRLDSNTSNISQREADDGKNQISFSLSDNNMNVPNILLSPQPVNDDVFVNLKDSQRKMSDLINKEKQQQQMMMTDDNLEIVDDEEGFYDFIEDDKEYSTDNIEIMEKFQKEYKESQYNGPNSFQNNKSTSHNHAIHSAPQTVNKNSMKNQQYQQEEAVVVEEPTRPQSRKLYLGSESTKASTLESNNNNQLRNTPKGVPKSAGARYGDYSPLKGGADQNEQQQGGGSPKATSSKSPRIKKGQFKKLSSHGDLQEWMDGAPTTTAETTTTPTLPGMRPPSRQSTAFPVHLSSNEKNAEVPKSGNESLAPATSTISIISGTVVTNNTATSAAPLSSTTKKQQHDSIQMMKQQPQQSLMLSTTEDNHQQDYNPPSSVSRTRQNFTVNTEPRSVKKQPSLEEAASDSYDKRPPSRQKIAAQHLFDDGSDQNDDSVTVTSRRSSSGRPDTRKGNEANESTSNTTVLSYDSRMKTAGISVSSGGGPRPLSTRGGHLPQKNSGDGFAELDADDPVAPFPITINSNTGSVSNANTYSEPLKSEYRHPPASVNRGHGDDYEFEFYSPANNNNSKISNRRTGGTGGSPRNSILGNTNNNTLDNYEYGTSHRPSSVSGIHHSNVGAGHHGNTNAPSAKSPYYYDKQEEHTTLRSKSANNYSHGHRLYNPVHTDHVNNTTNFINNSLPTQTAVPQSLMHPNKPSKSNPSGGRGQQPDSKRTRAWGDEPDPRHLPRAQNAFGMEADTGWTSPAMLNPYNSATYPDTMIVQDDDDMTILTEDSGGYNQPMDNSLSLQSFNIETSLDEDFLKLFAPAGR